MSWEQALTAAVACVCCCVCVYCASSLSSCFAALLRGADPRQRLLREAQLLQAGEMDSQAGGLFAREPFAGSAAVYTMSMDVKVEQHAQTWRSVMSHGPATGPECCDGAGMRKPAVFLTGTGQWPANRVHIVHADTRDANANVVTTFAAQPGRYFNLTWTVDGTSLHTFIDGRKDPSGSLTGRVFTWPSSRQPWLWSHPNYAKNGAVLVKNVRFWDRALKEEEVRLVGAAQTAS